MGLSGTSSFDDVDDDEAAEALRHVKSGVGTSAHPLLFVFTFLSECGTKVGTKVVLSPFPRCLNFIKSLPTKGAVICQINHQPPLIYKSDWYV